MALRDERRKELVGRVEELLEEFADMADFDLPVVTDWVLVVAIDDATDSARGACVICHPRHQWPHRTAGLLQSAADDVRCLTVAADD